MMKCVICQNEIRCRVSLKTEDAERPIETSYQWWYCEKCGAKYYATLEDSHVNMFDDKLLHKGDHVDEAKWLESLQWAMKCPDYQNAACTCEVHKNMPAFNVGGASWYTND